MNKIYYGHANSEAHPPGVYVMATKEEGEAPPEGMDGVQLLPDMKLRGWGGALKAWMVPYVKLTSSSGFGLFASRKKFMGRYEKARWLEGPLTEWMRTEEANALVTKLSKGSR